MTKTRRSGDCAIVGVAARLAGCASREAFWAALADQRSLVGALGEARRSLVDAGTTTRWGQGGGRGAFLSDIECFDPALFGLPPAAARFTDPRQRLLLEATWTAIEDAGLRRAELAGKKVAVFVAHDGWYLGSYVKRMAPELLRSQEFIVPGNAPSFLANRLSAVFDVHGPSMVFDATCSGTYVALHHACRALAAGDCEYAIVAAVTLFLDPWRDGETAATPFESPAGRVDSFSRRATGYTTAEGCGAFVVQRAAAERDLGLEPYAVIRGTGYNAAGKTASFAQPSRARVAELCRDVLAAAELDALDIDYIEAHGVGSVMADAVEANALIDVFGRPASAARCHVSTVKPNVGHGHASSGVYSLLKALLCLEHDQIPAIAGLSAGGLNEDIPADTQGLVFATETVGWPRRDARPRRMFLTSYGMSNVNAAVVLEEPSARQAAGGDRAAVVICLSARSDVQVREQARRLREVLAARPAIACRDLAYTLQVGREAMAHRFAVVVESCDELDRALAGLVADPAPVAAVPDRAPDADEANAVAAALGRRDVAALAALWRTGASIAWEACHDAPLPRRLHLPTYPFARERYWIPAPAGEPAAPAVLHPLIHRRAPDRPDPEFFSRFHGDEFFLADHVIQGHRILPAVAHLEMARAAAALAWQLPAAVPLALTQVVWARPLLAGATGVEVELRLQPIGDRRASYQICTRAGGRDGELRVHSQGVAELAAGGAAAALDLAALRAPLTEVIEAAELYALPPHLGLQLGPRLRGVERVHVGPDQALGRLVLPAELAGTASQFAMHPSVMDPILQLAYLALVGRTGAQRPLMIPFALDRLDAFAPSPPAGWIWIRRAAGSAQGDAVERLDLDLCDDAGRVCVRMQGFSFRALATLGRFASDAAPDASAAVPAAAATAPGAGLRDAAVAYLRRMIGAALYLEPHQLGRHDALAERGVDSLVAVRLTLELERELGALPRTLFFEVRSIDDLAAALLASHPAPLAALVGFTAPSGPEAAPVAPSPALRVPRSDGALIAPAEPRGSRRGLDIAVIGLAGRYPQARDLAELWANLRTGRDSITEVPAERWDWRAYYTEDRTRPGHHYSKWGGFLDGVDQFDPLLFGIPPREAELLDPQERLFLQCVWTALEDAGYTRETLRPGSGKDSRRVGVYAGVMYGEYQLFGVEHSLRGDRVGFASTQASIANRVSYVLDLHGPSMAIDTMCSSSLTAIHLACQDLVLGATDVGIAGGVNLSLHPAKYLELSRRQFVSGTGRCAAFGERGDGYVPGEGVGVAVLKRRVDAERDGDHIYGVIQATATNHGGKTSGYTVPDPNAQRGVVARALAQAAIDPRRVGYIEAHGTGTRLGDPIEIAGLSRAFADQAGGAPIEPQACVIGSIKSNIGHCESAAGIAGVTKVLLQLRHGQIAASLHSEVPNPHIAFATTPFRVSAALQDWPRPVIDGGGAMPRVAGVSSFGAGGSNAHVVIEEYIEESIGSVHDHRDDPAPPAAVVVPISAKDPDRLREAVANLRGYARDPGAASLAEVAYTLQVGREAMELRLAVIVRSLGELADKLGGYLAGESDHGCVVGSVVAGNGGEAALHDDDRALLVHSWLARGDLARLVAHWVRGLAFDWNQLYPGARPRRVSLPTYPFATERYWYRGPDASAPPSSRAAAHAWIHPLLERNTSDLCEQRFTSRFTGAERFVRDHIVAGQPVVSAAATLEMARAAVSAAGGCLRAAQAELQLRDVAWLRPIVVGSGGAELSLRMWLDEPGDGDPQIGYELYQATEAREPRAGGEPSEPDDAGSVHVRGTAAFVPAAAAAVLDLDGLRGAMTRGVLDAEACYERWRAAGIDYGPAQRGVAAIYLGDGEVVAELIRPAAGVDAGVDPAAWVLDPAMLDAAMHAAIGLELDASGDWTPGAPTLRVPCSLAQLDVVAACTDRMWAWVRHAEPRPADDREACFDLELCDRDGAVVARIRGLRVRALASHPITAARPDEAAPPAPYAAAVAEPGVLVAQPVWVDAAVAAPGAVTERGAHRVVLCDLPGVSPQALTARLAAPCVAWRVEACGPVARFEHHARRALELAQRVIAARPAPEGGTTIQLVVPGAGELALTAGLVGLWRTVHLEHPAVAGQIVLVPAEIAVVELADALRRCRSIPAPVVRLEASALRTLAWDEIEGATEGSAEGLAAAPAPWRDRGVYLITGGLGGLGRIFAEEILTRAPRAHVILAGRSAAREAALAELRALAAAEGSVSYRALDVRQPDEVAAVVREIVAAHGGLHGVLHAAGAVADRLIVHKTADELGEVLAPKVAGAYNLDEATRELELDWFVMFSSLAGTLGNVGQADYAAGNGFLDEFAALRAARVAANQRRGRTLSIGWPLWADGGMGRDAASQRGAAQLGLVPMSRAHGIAALYRGLAASQPRVIAMAGDLVRLCQLLRAPVIAVPPAAAALAARARAESTARAEVTMPAEQADTLVDHLRGLLAAELKIPVARIDADAAFGDYGLESVAALELARALEASFGPLSKALFFEHETLRAVAAFLRQAHPSTVRARFAAVATPPPAVATATFARAPVAAPRPRPFAPRTAVRADRGAAAAPGALDIAIVGISGRYPGARDLGALWTVLAGGKDCISEVPEDRWDWRHYQSGAAAHASKWGGFIAGFDEFDAAFFGLSAADARAIDPQERLVLEHAWAAVEDAGYTRASLVGPGRPGGVYAAVMYSDYQLFGATEEPGGERPLVTSLASIANRVSHLLDLRGPSMTIETMCSSSLTAVHLACQDLRRGHTALAIAGGVNLSVHPSKYAMLSAGRLISRSARSESFGEGGAGYVPGEGVGVVVLKRLEDAERDRDHVHAVIVGSAINHGGRAHGYFAPSPNAQREVVEQALADARLGPHEISYLEGHGTGTQLGDAVELAALTQVFGAAGPREPRCAIGSIKSNIGHAEAAAGMAALAKVVVQLRHRQLVPSLHAERANPNIDLATTPFRLSDVLAPWQPPVVAGRPGTPGRRIAGISAFGAGGSNAHLIVAEHRAAPPAIAQPADPVVVPLSASTPAQLQIRARQLLEVLEADEPIALADLAYTLQVGREAMAWRAGFVARTRDELIAQLAGFISGASDGGWFTGRAAPDRGLAALADDDELGAAIAGWIARRKLARLAELWTQGLEIDWRRLYPGEPPRRTPLPTYPFARDRHHVRRAEPAEPTRDAAPAPRDSSIRPVAPAPSLAGATTLADKVERLVVGFLRNTARSAAVGPDTELAALALDSVAVVGFVALWRAVVGTTIPAVAIYQARTPRELAHHITSHPGISDAALDAAGARLARRGAPTGERFALSAMQESFIVGRRLPTAGQAISSTIYLELEVRAALAVETLEQAWNSLVRHHDALRARITEDYTQAIAPVVPVYRIAVDDLSALDGAAQLARLAAHRDRMIDPVFDLERGPCFEVRMSRLAGDHAIVHLAIDELVADGFSVHLLAGQLMRACAAPPVEPAPLGYSYREYVETLHALTAEPASRASVDHWKSKLGPRPAPAPRFAHDAIAGGPKVRCLAGTLPAALWQAIQDGARARRCYPSAVLLTVFADVLAEHRGQDALRLGVTKRNRMAVHADVMRLVGLFITTNPFVHHRAPGEEFDARLGRTQHQLEADAPHEHVDATAVSRALRADGAPEPIDLPVIFTSLVSPGFGELAPGGAWRIRDVLNTTPGVQLDHQTFEQDGALAVRWYVPAGIAARGEVPAIFEAYLAELARRAGEFARAAAPDGGAPFALTHPQIAYAFGRLAAADHAAGCALHLEYELDGLDLARLNRAWREIRAHHPMLRASVLASGQQRILDVTPDSPVELDAAATSRDDYERRCQAIRQTMLAHDFPLDSYPYAAIAACALEGGPARIFLHLDLLIADARSAMLIARQLLGRYHDARYPLPGAAGSFRDHVIARLARRTGEAAAADTAYWEPKLARLPSGPALATTARPASRERHQLVRTLDCLAGLEARARRLGVALDTVLLAAYGEALVAWNAGAPCTAVVVSWDREPVFAGVDELVGDFTRLSWVAFAADPAHPADADARIRDAHAQLAADLARRSVDGLEVLRTRKGLALPAVFTCMTPGPAPAHAISQTPGVVVDAIARIAGDSALAIHWDSIAADRATEGDMFDRYCATLERWAALEAIDPPVDPPIELPAHGILLHEMFERQVAAHGARPAVVFGDTWVSYDELERRTRRVAGWLRAHGAQPDDVVAVFMDRSIEMVVALMAILRAGAAYLPLDVAAPQARTQQIVTSSRTRWVLTHRAQRSRWTARGALDVVCIDADDELGEVSAAAPAEVTEHHLAYVIYTSGSTGAPKGCMIEHRSITNRIAWMQRQFPLRPGDCVLQKTPYSFDVSVWEFFWPLAVGATIVVARPGGHLDASYLLDLIDRARITVCHFVPSMLRIVLAEPDLERMSRMQRVFVSGEALDYDVMEQFLDRVGIPLDNLYGPTEAAVDVSHWPCRKNPARETAIGRAISAVQLHVLDDQLQEVACGELGELYIGGVAVGRGYLGDPGLTAKSFIASPFGLPGTLYRTGDLASRTPDGDLRYGGRRDGQVKLNGLRIELAEIEHHLRGHAAVEDAMVAMEGAAGKELLVAYVVPRDPGARPAREALRELLRERVPAYMIPHAFVSIAAIPLTAHGKRRRGGPPITGIQTTDQPAGRALVALLRELPR